MKFTIKTSIEKTNEGISVINSNGGSFDGKNFSISGVEGTLKYSDGNLFINITDKPWLASWGMIEDKINSFFK